MKSLKAKLKKKGGFTLVEMLIVVAIIAILVMVSVPMINSSLEKAREAVDDANLRGATSLGSVYYLSNLDGTEDFSSTGGGVTLYYAIDKTSKEGRLVKEANKPTVGYGETSDHKDQIIQVVIKEPSATDTNPVVKATWEDIS